MLAETSYGKSSVRLVKVSRRGDRHDLKDLTVAIRFEGEYSNPTRKATTPACCRPIR